MRHVQVPGDRTYESPITPHHGLHHDRYISFEYDHGTWKIEQSTKKNRRKEEKTIEKKWLNRTEKTRWAEELSEVKKSKERELYTVV